MYGYIYKTTDLSNGKIYIGQKKSSNFVTHYYGSGTHISNAIRKRGKGNFKVELICEASNLIELNEKEIYYISKFDALNPNIGYNVSSGGRTKYKIPDSVKNSIRQKALARYRDPNEHIKTGEAVSKVVRTEEHRSKLSYLGKQRYLNNPEQFVNWNQSKNSKDATEKRINTFREKDLLDPTRSIRRSVVQLRAHEKDPSIRVRQSESIKNFYKNNPNESLKISVRLTEFYKNKDMRIYSSVINKLRFVKSDLEVLNLINWLKEFFVSYPDHKLKFLLTKTGSKFVNYF